MEANLLLGLGISFSLAILLTVLFEGDMKTFLACLLIFTALMVFAGVLDLWIMLLVFLGVIVVLYLEFKGIIGVQASQPN